MRLGRAQYGRRCLARMEDQQLILAPQRTGKSGIIADRLLDHPGPAIVTSTRTDLYQLTAGARSQTGPLFVWNPQHVGALPSTFGFDLLAPCRDLVMARRMAGWLTGAIASENANHGNLEWFEKKGDVATMALLYAAALGGYTITDVYRWVQLDGHENALRVLAGQPGSRAPAGGGPADVRGEQDRRVGPGDHRLVAVLGGHPGPGRRGHPARGEGFDLAEFIAGNGTLYLIASGDEDSPVAPLFRAFTSWVHWQAGLIGSTGRAGRLDPPLWLGLDEVTTICPVDLPVMLSDSAGKGVLITAVAHGTSQLEERWGQAGARTVWACCGTKVILGGDQRRGDAGGHLAAVRDHRHRRGRQQDRPNSPSGTDPGPPRLAGARAADEPVPGDREVPARVEAAGLPVRPARPGLRPAPAGRAGPGAGTGPGRGGARPVRGGPGQVLRSRLAAGHPGSRPVPAAVRPGSARLRAREAVIVSGRIRRPQIIPGPRCGWPDRECKAPASAHGSGGGERRAWTYHDAQCQVPNPQPGPHLDGYPECGLVDGHAGGCDYVRHAAEGFLRASPAPEPEIEAEP